MEIAERREYHIYSIYKAYYFTKEKPWAHLRLTFNLLNSSSYDIIELPMTILRTLGGNWSSHFLSLWLPNVHSLTEHSGYKPTKDVCKISKR